MNVFVPAVSPVRLRPPSAAGEDRNTGDDPRAVRELAKLRPPSAAGEDRNDHIQRELRKGAERRPPPRRARIATPYTSMITSRLADALRPPSAAGEDRNRQPASPAVGPVGGGEQGLVPVLDGERRSQPWGGDAVRSN